VRVAFGRALLVALATVAGGCGSRRAVGQSQTTTSCSAARVLVVAAFADELEPLLEQSSVAKSMRLEPGAFVCAAIAGRDAALLLSGVGPANARRSAQRALDSLHVSSVMFVGIAGGIGRRLRIGDVVIPARWSRHDQPAHWYPSDHSLFAVASKLVAPSLHACTDAAVCAPQPSLTVGGNGVTGASFVADPAAAADLERRLDASVTDMETAVVAEVAQSRAVPFIAVRAVSDVVRTGRSAGDVERYGDVAAYNAAAVAARLLRAASP
jgi:adenosylhomocysteine nucleosidase